MISDFDEFIFALIFVCTQDFSIDIFMLILGFVSSEFKKIDDDDVQKNEQN